MQKRLDLSLIHPELHSMAIEKFEAGDSLGLLCLLSSKLLLNFVWENMHSLKERGIFEASLFDAYTGTDMVWQYRGLKLLFDFADRTKLRAAGDPIPDDQPDGKFTLYRGVSGLPGHRKVSGMSWTRSLEKAIWFANWRNPPNPTVYQTVASVDDVYFYTNEREEEEFVMRAKKYRKLNVLCG